MFQGFAVSSSGSRTAVAEQSGAKSQLTGLVGAGVRRAPAPVLQLAPRRPAADGTRRGRDRGRASRWPTSRRSSRFARARMSSLALSLAATAGVVFFGVLAGIVIAIALSILLFFQRSWWPNGEILGRVELDR